MLPLCPTCGSISLVLADHHSMCAFIKHTNMHNHRLNKKKPQADRQHQREHRANVDKTQTRPNASRAANLSKQNQELQSSRLDMFKEHSVNL